LIAGYLLDELTASRLLCPIMLIRISLRANPDDRLVINRVLINGHVGLSIGFVVACCLMAA
jgi:hypothetical protein